jgi:hypothetical protein
MPVLASDGRAGRVDDVLTDSETGEPAYVVIDAGGFFKGDVVVPISEVRTVDDAGVWLNLSRSDVKHAPTYDPLQFGSAQGLVSSAAKRFGDK